MTMRRGNVELKLTHSRRVGSQTTQRPAEFRAAREGLLNALPDIQVEVEDTAADGDHLFPMTLMLRDWR